LVSPFLQATKALRERYSSTLFLDLGTRRGEGSASRPGRFIPGKDLVPIVQEAGWALEGVRGQRHAPAALSPGKTWYPLYERLGGPQGRSGQVRKIVPPPGFDPRTVQPVASRFTD
jgi:hypothetical protein